MTSLGGAERRAWRSDAEPANPADQKRPQSDASSSVLDVATDPELASRDRIDATRPIPIADTTTEPGAQSPTPHRSRPSLAPPEPADTAPVPERPPVAPGPHGTRRLPAHLAAAPLGATRPDTRTRSLASLGDGDEPPNEPTRLGELAGPEAFTPDPAGVKAPSPLLSSPPVHHAPAGAVPQSETIAAPGELAGLVEDLERRVDARKRAPRPSERAPRSNPGASDGPPLPPDIEPAAVPKQRRSEVRRALTSPVPNPSASPASPEAAGAPKQTPASGPRALSEAAHASLLEETNDQLDAPAAPRPAPLEATDALVEEFQGEKSERMDDVLGAVDAPFLDADSDTGSFSVNSADRLALGAFSESHETEHEDASRVLTLPARSRRLFATFMDGLIIGGLIALPTLLGVFGDATAEASPFDPDDLSRLLTQGELTPILITSLVLGMLYVFVSTTLSGKSIGKIACRLEVVDTRTGVSPNWVRAALRGAIAVCSALLGGAGLLLPLVDRHRRALHDTWSGTTVVLRERDS